MGRQTFRNISCVLAAVVFCAVIASSSFASIVNVNPGDDVGAALNSANSGDVVSLAAGTFNLSAPITISSGVTLLGVSPASTHIVFNLAGGNDTSYGILVPANAHDVKITELDLYSNHGLINMSKGAGYKNIQIARNNLQYGGGQFANGTLVFGIYGTVTNDGLQITHNYFHDSPDTVRNWCIWFATNANLDYNLFYNINDGGQIDSPGPNVSFSYNYGTYMHRMGQEVSIQSDSDFTCNGNTFFDYVNPYYDTEGVSIVGGTGEVDITNNFFRASIAPGSTWGQADSGGAHRFGYAIECTGSPSNVSQNTIIGTWAELVSSDIAGASVTNNDVYGTGMWANFSGEPGPFGFGSVHAVHNSMDSDPTDAPVPPANAHAGPKKHSL